MEKEINQFLQLECGRDSGRGWGGGEGQGDDWGEGWGEGWGSGRGEDWGDGRGWGSGRGEASGWGSGEGSASGWGSGRGSGRGSGEGSGKVYGIKSFCNEAVYRIDGIQTLIDRVHGNVARGRILNGDLTITPCYIVKNERYFAHGETLQEAQAALFEKIVDDLPIEEKIAEFMGKFQPGTEYPARMFYDWHHFLTGSCKAGRDAFARDHEIDVDDARMTPEAFMALTRDAYGGRVIKQLEESWKAKYK